MIPRTVAPIIALSLLLATPAIHADCGPALTGPPCTWGGLAATGPAEPSISLGAGNPVHLATGNKYQQDTDLPANPDAPGLELVRHYNALDPRPSLLGRGWAWSYDTRLYRSDTAWQIIQADGGRLLFPDSGIASDGSHIGRHGRLDHVDSHHNWFWPDGTAVRFDDQGLLVAIRFPSGESVYVDRHRDDDHLEGAIRRVINDRAQEMAFAYAIADGHARLQSVSTALGTFHYDHDLPPEPALAPATHRLTGVTRPDGMRRGYLYDASLQNGHPYALTGITLSPGPASADSKDAPRGPLLISSWAYDDQGRAIRSTHKAPDGTASHLQLEYRQTASQRVPGLTVITDEKGQETRVHTAIRGSRHVVTSVEGAGCTGCAAPGTRADYDRHGRLVSVNGTRITRTDDGRVHRLQPARSGWPGLGLHYNADGLRERWHSALTGTETMRYNAQGLPVKRHFANGDTTTFDYDVQHRPVAMHDRHGDAHTSTRLHWHGHWLTRIEHPAETEVRHYDPSGQVIQREILRDPADTGHRIHLKEHFSYDAQQRLVRHDLPEGGSLHYEWGQGPQITAIHWQDASGRKHQVIASRPDQAGYFWGNGIRLETRADPHHRVRELQLHNGQRLFWSQQLDYDTQQRVSRETIFADTGVTPARHATWDYAYDDESRLIGYRHRHAEAQASVASSATPAAPAHAGMPDTTGLSARKPVTPDSDTTTWLAWHADGSAAALRNAAGTVRPAIVRDASGLPRRVDDHDVTYGANRRLQTVSRGGKPLVQYRHNAFGYQISRHTPTGRSDFFYLNNQLVAQSDGQSAIRRRYVYAHHVPVAVIDYSFDTPQAQLLAVHSDLLGAPRLITDARQRVRWHADYSPTGRAHIVSADIPMALRLPGQVADPDTGWHDNLLRTYLPDHGHYLEPDPLGPVPGNQALGYARQQPRLYADPMGLLLFAFDGTRHSASTQSNVWKLSRYYLDGPVHYHPGPGNSMFVELDALTAHQASTILETQWKWLLVELSRPQAATTTTPIDILGFSRGAALARHFGNMVAQHVHQGLFQFNDPVHGAVSACVDLRFMGLFDTVAQFGIGGRHNRNYDLGIPGAWEWVAHAVALHEHRWLFPLTAAGSSLAHNVVEAPFIGAHADIGGGVLPAERKQSGEHGDLSNVALNWMVWQARAASVPLADLDPQDSTISYPVLHDYRTPLMRTIQAGDRRVDAQDGQRWLNYQDDHPRLGRNTRRQAESLIRRHPGWESRSGSDVGTVDMDGYAQWLHDELGWHAAPV